MGMPVQNCYQTVEYMLVTKRCQFYINLFKSETATERKRECKKEKTERDTDTKTETEGNRKRKRYTERQRGKETENTELLFRFCFQRFLRGV